MTAARIPMGLSAGRKVWLEPDRRMTHMHVVGGSNMGKSKFLEHLIREDVLAGHGLCLIDPHGELYRDVVQWCAENRIDRTRNIHLIDPSQKDWRTGFNPLARHPGERPLDRVDSMIDALAQVWGGENSMETPSIRSVLRAVFTILIENGQTISDAFPLTRPQDEASIREYFTEHTSNPIVREMWEGYELQAARAPREFLIEFGGPRRRLFELLHDDQMREMLGQVAHALDFRHIMDNNEIVLVNLGENAVEERRGRALGAMLVRELFLVAKRRDVDHAKDNPFYLYIDECAQYLTPDISKLLAQTRKFGLHAILAHQWLDQLREASPAIFAAVMAIQNKVVFGGLADSDADLIAGELFRTEWDIEMPVERLIKPTVVGVVQTWLHHWSESTSEGEVETSSATETTQESAGVSQLFDQDGYPIGGYTASANVGGGASDSESAATSITHSRSSGESEAYIPEFRDLPSAVHSLENVRHLAIVRLRSLPERHAIVKGSGVPSFELITFPTHPATVHPSSYQSFTARLLSTSPYSLPAAEARQRIDHRVETLHVEAQTWRSPPAEAEEPDQWRG